MNNILIVNAGSSSLKYQLIDMTDEHTVAKGNVERIGIEGSKLTHKHPGRHLHRGTAAERPHRRHPPGARSAHGSRAWRDLLHGRDQRGWPPRAARRREVRGQLSHQRRGNGGHRGEHPAGPLHNPANLDGHPRLPGSDAGHAHGGGVRYRFPYDHAQGSVSVRPAAGLL